MRILHVTPYYTPAYAFGGVVRSVEGMTRALARRGHEVAVLTTDALNQQQRYKGALEEVIAGVRVVRVSNRSRRLRGRLNLSTPDTMQGMARELLPDYDVIHCHEFRTVENLLVTPVAAAQGKPLVLSPHGTLARDTGRGTFKAAWDYVLSPAVAGRFAHVVGLTQREADEARVMWASFGCKHTRFSVVPNGVDPDDYNHLPGREAFRQRYGLGDGPVCLFMGRLHPRKGVRVLVEAFRQADVPGARLVIAGPDEGVSAALAPALDERMVMTGFLDGATRLAAFGAADMLALPAVGEGLPMVVLEAMSAGLPVLISPECHLPEVAEAGAGVIVPPEAAPLAEALRALLTDAPRRAAMSAAARQLAQTRFTWDAVAQQMEAVYAAVESPEKQARNR